MSRLKLASPYNPWLMTWASIDSMEVVQSTDCGQHPPQKFEAVAVKFPTTSLADEANTPTQALSQLPESRRVGLLSEISDHCRDVIAPAGRGVIAPQQTRAARGQHDTPQSRAPPACNRIHNIHDMNHIHYIGVINTLQAPKH
jgi:hypothetical protein